MKKNHNFKRILSVWVLVIFIANLFIPTVALALDNASNENSIDLTIERRVLGEADILSVTKQSIVQGENAAVAIDRIFEELDIQYEYTGSLEKNFYIAAITTPEGEFLSEFDHGSVSGWKYSVNGIYPNVGLADYEFKAGDKVRIQYTAKDMGQDILVVDTIYNIREKLKEAESFSKDKYTEETFNKLQAEIAKVKEQIPSDVQIGEMMSVTLGDGECDTYQYGKEMEGLLKGLENAIEALEEKPVEPEKPQIIPEFEINPFRTWDKVDDKELEQPNTVYLQEGQNSIGAKIISLTDSSLPVIYDGEELEVVNGSALVEIKPGIHTLSVKRWGKPYEISIVCKTLPYTIEGNPTPGGTVTINFHGGVEEGIKDGRYELKETRLEYNTDIPDLKLVSSETIEGAPVDREKLSKVTFTIPKDTEPGQYELTGGGVYQTWGYRSYNGGFNGKFSVLPNIKLTVKPSIDLENAYSVDLNNWSKFDKVYTLENEGIITLAEVNSDSQVLLNGELVYPIDNVYTMKLPLGENIISVDGKEYEISCNKVSYTITNGNKLIPGSKVVVQFEGLEKAFGDIPGEYDTYLVKTVFKSNIPGVETVESKEASSSTEIDDEILNKIEFTIPEGTAPGEYELYDGSIYQAWKGSSILGEMDKNFSIIPKVKLQVRDSIPEDNIPPEISTTIKDGETVTKEKLDFSVIATDDVDGNLKPIVKVNEEIINEISNGKYAVILNEGVNHIEIKAVDDAGNEAVETYSVTFAPKLREGASIILDTLNLVLNTGEKHQLIAVDAPDSRSKETDETAKMSYEVISGADVAKVNKDGLVEGLKPGFAEISVRYPGLTTPAIVQVHVKAIDDVNGPKITTSIEETKYDILYYTGDSRDYSFTVDGEGSSIEVTINNEVVEPVNGAYKVQLTEGHNLIKIQATKNGATSYEAFNIRAKKLAINIENLSKPGQEIYQGDRVKISFKGLETPVPKFLRVYNPKRTRVQYETNMPGATNIYGTPTQYNIAMNNAIEFTATTAGVHSFTGGNIEEAWWGDELYSERDISGDGPNMSAVVRQGNFSDLPDFTIEVKENKEFQSKYTAEILNKEPIKPGDEVTLKINNLDMPEADSGYIMQAQTIFNTDIEGLKEIKSKDAVSDFSQLQTISFKVPEGTEAGTYTITNGRVFKEWQPGVLYVDSEFYKGELPEIKLVVTKDEETPVPPIDTTTPVEVINPSMTVEEGINHAIKWTVENIKNPTFGNEWDILGLVRSGLFKDKAYLDTYYNNLVEVVKEKKGILTRNKYTEYSRTIIALTALGKDPRNVGGYDLVEKLYDFKKVSAQGINGVIFALIALDTNEYEIPKTADNSRERMIQAILDSQLKDGGFALSGTKGNVDVTGMALQALANYKEQPQVQAVIDKAIEFLSNVQLSDGGYSSDDVKNIEASVQVIVALTSLGIEPRCEAFVKDKNWIVSDMMNFAAKGSGFKHSLDQDSANDMATEQALYGLAAYRRFTEGQTSIYDMSDVVLDNGENNGNNNGNDDNGDNENDGSSEGSGGSGSENEDNSGTGNQGGTSSGNQDSGNNGSGANNGNNSGNQGVIQGQGNGNSNQAVNDKKDTEEQKDSKEEATEKEKDEKGTEKDILSSKADNDDECNHEENYYSTSNKQPLTNIQVVFLTLAAVFVVSAIKEVIVAQYKKKKKQSEEK